MGDVLQVTRGKQKQIIFVKSLRNALILLKMTIYYLFLSQYQW